MKRLLFTLCFSLVVVSLNAQQHTNYTQYTLNRFALNPALAGIKPCAETTFGQRKQWFDFEGAPKVTFASFNTRLNKEDKYPKNFHGVGVYIHNDQLGIDGNFSMKFAYAYHIKLWVNFRASVGIFAGIQQKKRSYSSIRARNKNIDPAFNKDVSKAFIYPEISPGGFIYNKNFYMGLSMFQLYPAKFGSKKKGYLGTEDSKLTGHYFLSSGYRFRTRTFDYIPSAMLSFSPFISPTLDFTLTFDYQQKISIALGSKYLNSAYATLQLRLLNTISLGYSYEYALNEINKVAPQTHEIIISFSQCSTERRKVKFICPAYQ